ILRAHGQSTSQGDGNQLRVLRAGRSYFLADVTARWRDGGRVAAVDGGHAGEKAVKRAAIGVRAHSGWAALVAVAGKPGSVQVLDRRRIVIADAQAPGANQPYHFAEKLEVQAAEKHLASCAAVSG